MDVRKDRVVTYQFRLQAQILNFSSTRLLWINSYFPTDPQNAAFDDGELLEVLAEVEKIMDNNAYDDILWQGDLNWDMSRDSYFSLTMKRFMSRIRLVSLWDKGSLQKKKNGNILVFYQYWGNIAEEKNGNLPILAMGGGTPYW